MSLLATQSPPSHLSPSINPYVPREVTRPACTKSVNYISIHWYICICVMNPIIIIESMYSLEG